MCFCAIGHLDRRLGEVCICPGCARPVVVGKIVERIGRGVAIRFARVFTCTISCDAAVGIAANDGDEVIGQAIVKLHAHHNGSLVDCNLLREDVESDGQLSCPAKCPFAYRTCCISQPIIRQIQSEGPYQLLGMSSGGLIAFEMAQQIKSNGGEVSFLGLLDTTVPGSYTEPVFTSEFLLRAMAGELGCADLMDTAPLPETLEQLLEKAT